MRASRYCPSCKSWHGIWVRKMVQCSQSNTDSHKEWHWQRAVRSSIQLNNSCPSWEPRCYDLSGLGSSAGNFFYRLEVKTCFVYRSFAYNARHVSQRAQHEIIDHLAFDLEELVLLTLIKIAPIIFISRVGSIILFLPCGYSFDEDSKV